MYLLLKQIPRFEGEIHYTELDAQDKWNLLCEAKYDSYDYVNQSGDLVDNSSYSLTEKGQAAIEDFERAERNDKVIKKTLKISTVAMWAAIGSAITAILSLIKILY